MIAVDPGVSKGIGVAGFQYDDNGPSAPFANSMLVVAKLFSLEETISTLEAARRTLVVIEMPRIYPAAQQKGDQNDLLELARVCGRLEQAALAAGHTVETVYPRAWKGTIDKVAMTERIESRLTSAEYERIEFPSAKSLRDNVTDAVGIGLWKLGRLEPRKVYAR